ncbi:MAG: SPASM domain-containing protein [Clostridia bacterium]|nr:SPASM domain-containing protein [Clostridia bacterium]
MSKPLKKAYLEITNICNLDCSFCHKTAREKRFIGKEAFAHAVSELSRVADYVYYHVMGEPLLHPELAKLFEITAQAGMKSILTTNGTLLKKREAVLLNAPSLHKISISLHAYEANGMTESLDSYIDGCLDFADKASARGIIVALRLWNIGGKEALNSEILEKMHRRFGENFKETRGGYQLKDHLYLEWGDYFEWPDLDAERVSARHSCYGLRDQVAVLVDGSVIPCCLDAEGVLTLGNLFTTPIEEILSSPRAIALKRSFETRCITEELCLRCDFATKRVR